MTKDISSVASEGSQPQQQPITGQSGQPAEAIRPEQVINQRPLKVRVWHIPTQRMYDNVSFDSKAVRANHEGGRCTQIGKDDSGDYVTIKYDSFKREDCVLLQSTSFVDEVGAEVWEGDVMRSDITLSPEEIADGDEEFSCYYYVFFCRGGFAMLPVGVDETEARFNDFDFFSENRGSLCRTRVGSLLEHPKLLELTED